MEEDNKNIVQVFKALADARRVKVIRLLQRGERCACQLLEDLDMGQSSLSYHMKILVESGLVQGRVEGKWTHYSICQAGYQKAISLLGELSQLKEESPLEERRKEGLCPCPPSK